MSRVNLIPNPAGRVSASRADVVPRCAFAHSGDSAGGNLATAVAMKLRDSHFQPRPKLQVLLYPALQAVDFHTPSYHQGENLIIVVLFAEMLLTSRVAKVHSQCGCGRKHLNMYSNAILFSDSERYGTITNWRNMVQFWLSYARGSLRHLNDVMHSRHVSQDAFSSVSEYLNYTHLPSTFVSDEFSSSEIGSPDGYSSSSAQDLQNIVTDPYFSPLLAKDLSDMPKTFIMTVEHDVLRDEGALYAHRLRRHDVNVTHKHITSGLHGLVSFHWFLDARLAFELVVDFIRSNS